MRRLNDFKSDAYPTSLSNGRRFKDDRHASAVDDEMLRVIHKSNQVVKNTEASICCIQK